MSWTDLDVPGATSMRVHTVLPTAEPPPAGGRDVVLLHELFGVEGGVRAFGAELAAVGHRVLMPELYHRTAPAGTAFERDDEGRSQGFAHLGRLDRQDVITSVGAVLDHAAATGSGPGPACLVGFSAGANAAFLVATRVAVPVTVCVYPGWLTGTDVPLGGPTPTLAAAGGISGRIELLVGETDHVISPEQVAEIRAGLRAGGVDHEVTVIADAGHAYMWPGTPAYDADARAETTRRVLAALRR
ncbi:dienelactone hydrolase family protein [soil metagenome]